jgi:hypothetical protein
MSVAPYHTSTARHTSSLQHWPYVLFFLAQLNGLPDMNDATRWGMANEPNALLAYSAHTGNLVEPTGLHVHKHADWLAGSPDGLIGTEGIVEAKCPYWSKTPHQTIPLYYYLQINLCLECADREWCDFISWTPGAHKVIRVTRDRDLHGVLASTHSTLSSTERCATATDRQSLPRARRR